MPVVKSSDINRVPIDKWKSELKKLSLAPYVGPRPQTSDHEGMLIGRDELLGKLEDAVINTAVTVLDGDSGSGKTSLVRNGLIERLGRAGFKVFVWREWPGPQEDGTESSGSLPMTYVDHYLLANPVDFDSKTGGLPELDGSPIQSQELPNEWTDPDAHVSWLCASLEEVLDRPAVLVFDQFEELLRHHPRLGRSMMNWVRNVSRFHGTRVVLSLRSDSLHLLSPHMRGFGGYDVTRETVPPLEAEEHIRKIVTTHLRDSALPELDISEEFQNWIIGVWRDHLTRGESTSLLGLQALLETLYFQSRKRSGLDLSKLSNEKLRMEVQDLSGSAAIEWGLRESVTLALEHAQSASRQVGLDDYLLEGTRELVRRSVPYLWSGGFKVEAWVADLVPKILEPELRILRPAISREATPLAAMDTESMVGEITSEWLSSADLLRTDPSVREEVASSITAAHDATAGPLMGYPAALALIEECRRAAFAITWLIETKILRQNPDGILTLVHDGSGPALRQWARENAPGFSYAVHRLTAARGEQFDWRGADLEPAGGGTRSRKAEDPIKNRVLSNLNWRDCRISADFADLVMVNCDFRGARFVESRFEGVTFVNCLLDDANFEKCDFIGTTGLEPQLRPGHAESKVRIAPSFTVPTTEEVVKAFLVYVPQEVTGRPSTFFSDRAGRPAMPGTRPEGHTGEEVRFQAASGGVAIIGGRVCFLTFYQCTSKSPDGTLTTGPSIAFHHVSGGGLDIVECTGGAVEMHDCSVRGVSMTRDAPTDEGRANDTSAISFRSTDSFLVSTYFSSGLEGTAEFIGCTIWSLLNASGGEDGSLAPGLIVKLHDCRHQFLANVATISGSAEDSSMVDPPRGVERRYFEDTDEGRSIFVAESERLGQQLEMMDYRYDPGVRELRLRELEAQQHRGT